MSLRTAMRRLYTVSRNKAQIQPMKVRTRKGYAKNGSGDVVGSSSAPQKILVAVMTKRIEAAMPMRRTPTANSFGILISKRAVAHKAVPAANEGTLPAKLAAVPEKHYALSNRKHKKPSSNNIIPLSEELQSQQTGSHHETGSVDSP
jgi:hypothetical protein